LNDKTNRNSDQAWLFNTVDPLILAISEKVAKLSKHSIENQEDLQVVHYEANGFFKSHYDACEGSKSFCERMDGLAGPRIWTYIVYLNDNYEGGETYFPYLNHKVVPKKENVQSFKVHMKVVN
jgi:prolyl 4-hydroxylase